MVVPHLNLGMFMQSLFHRYKDSQDGATAVEYAMLLGLFAAGIVVWGTRAGEDLDTEMVIIAEALDEAPGGDNAPVITPGGD